MSQLLSFFTMVSYFTALVGFLMVARGVIGRFVYYSEWWKLRRLSYELGLAIKGISPSAVTFWPRIRTGLILFGLSVCWILAARG